LGKRAEETEIEGYVGTTRLRAKEPKWENNGGVFNIVKRNGGSVCPIRRVSVYRGRRERCSPTIWARQLAKADEPFGKVFKTPLVQSGAYPKVEGGKLHSEKGAVRGRKGG